jgi:cell division protease FtsH
VYYPEESGSQFLGGLGGFDSPREYSEATAREIDLQVRKIIDDALTEVRTILFDRRDALDALAKRLMEKETIDGNELRELLQAHSAGPKLVPASDAIKSIEKTSEEEPRELREAKGP